MTSNRSNFVSRFFATNVQTGVIFVCVFALLVESAYAIVVPPASGFETSVVRAYPLPFWVAFYTVIVGSIYLFVASAVSGSSTWRHGIVTIACNYALFMFLPSFRGYALYGRGKSDILSHFGYVKSILDTGYFPDSLWYPAEHILVTELTLFGFPLVPTKYLLSFAFMFAYTVSMALLLREFTQRRTAFLAGLAASVPLVYSYFHLTLHPAILSFFLVPAVLACTERYRRTASAEYFVLSSLVLLLIVFFHPMTGLLVALFLTVTILYTRFHRTTQSGTTTPLRNTLLLLFVPVWLLWYGSLEKTESEVQGFVEALARGRPSGGAVEASQALEAGLTVTQIFMRFVELYGMIFLYAAVAGLFCLYVAVQMWRGRARFVEGYATTQFGVGVIVAVTFLSVYLVAVGPIRVSRYMILAATILVALLLERTLRSDTSLGSRGVMTVLLVGLVVTAAALGANAAYWPNKHMTEAEYQGSNFMLSQDKDEVPIRSHKTSWKMSVYVIGEFDNHPGTFRDDDPRYLLAPRLGYQNNSTAWETFGHSYLATKTLDRKYHTAAYFTPQQRRAMYLYNSSHLRQATSDPTVQRVYANGGFTGWYIPLASNESNQSVP